MFTAAASVQQRRDPVDISSSGLIKGTKIAMQLIAQLESSSAADRQQDSGVFKMRENGIDSPDCGAETICDSFDYITSSYITFMSFKRFLEHEQSLENLHFWMDVEVFKTLPDDLRLESYGRAQSLNDRFVKPRAPFEVNVASHLKQMVAKTLKKVEEGENSISLDIFDKAQKEVLNVMRRDSYARFKKSDLYVGNQTMLTMLLAKGENPSTFYVPCGYSSTAKCVCGLVASQCPMPPRQVWPLHSLVHRETAVGTTTGVGAPGLMTLGMD